MKPETALELFEEFYGTLRNQGLRLKRSCEISLYDPSEQMTQALRSKKLSRGIKYDGEVFIVDNSSLPNLQTVIDRANPEIRLVYITLADQKKVIGANFDLGAVGFVEGVGYPDRRTVDKVRKACKCMGLDFVSGKESRKYFI
jgi:hypothetical protein